MIRYLLEVNDFLPRKQLPKVRKIGDVEDYWQNGKIKHKPINDNEDLAQSINDTFPSDEGKGCYVVGRINNGFLNDVFLNVNAVKSLLPELDDYCPLGERVIVHSGVIRSGIVQRKGWLSIGYSYGAEGPGETMVIYKGDRCAIGTQKSSIEIIPDA